MLPIHKAVLSRPRRLHLGYEFGTDPRTSWTAQFERNKRGITSPEVAAAAKVYYPNQNRPSYDPGTPPTPNPHRDWHKYSDFRITVSNQHRATSDSDADSDACHTITAAIALAATWHANLSLIYTDPIIEIEVHGGQYDERVTISVDYLRFQGIGMPVWTCTTVGSDVGVINVTGACKRFFFDGFEVVNIGGLEGTRFNDNCGLYMQECVESGIWQSDTWISNCYFHGTGTQIFDSRWSYYENVTTYSSDNFANAWAYASVVFRIGTAHTRTKWTELVGCKLSGQNDTGDPLKKGQAFAIIAKEMAAGNLTTWVPNAFTIGTDPTYSRTGVTLQWCTIIGWAENYGWALEYFACEVIEGSFINSDGAGSVHLFMYDNTTPGGGSGVNCYTWFTAGVGKVNYLIMYNDVNIVANPGDVPFATANAWLSHYRHSAPAAGAPFPGGSVMLQQAGGAPLANMYVMGSMTSKQFWLNVGVPTYQTTSQVNVPQAAMMEGFLNV